MLILDIVLLFALVVLGCGVTVAGGLAVAGLPSYLLPDPERGAGLRLFGFAGVVFMFVIAVALPWLCRHAAPAALSAAPLVPVAALNVVVVVLTAYFVIHSARAARHTSP